jgi:alpha-L-glutamate ligase-like protein
VVSERIAPGRWRTAGGELLTADALRRHLAHIVFGAFCKKGDDRAFIERRVTPPAFFAELSPGGLADLRIITLFARPIVAMLRIPTSLSGGRANLSQGGLGVAINLSSGRITRAVLSGASVTEHPDTGVALIGRVVPGWPALLDLARRAARAVPLEYLGVDLVVDETFGPRVLEINARPGIEIQNVHGVGIGKFLAEAGW